MGISEQLPAQERERLRRSLAFARTLIDELNERDVPFSLERVSLSGEHVTIYYSGDKEAGMSHYD